jgi:hypothetical protein
MCATFVSINEVRKAIRNPLVSMKNNLFGRCA